VKVGKVYHHNVQLSNMEQPKKKPSRVLEDFTKAQWALLKNATDNKPEIQSTETVIEIANLLDLHNKIVKTTENSRYILIFLKGSALEHSIANLFLNLFPENVGVSMREGADQDRITVISKRCKFGPSRAALVEFKAIQVADLEVALSVCNISKAGFTLSATKRLQELATHFPQLI